MIAEGDNPKHDVIWGFAVTNMVDPRILASLESYKPKGADRLDARFRDPQDRWVATTGYMAAFCVNTEVLKAKNLPMPPMPMKWMMPISVATPRISVLPRASRRRRTQRQRHAKAIRRG